MFVIRAPRPYRLRIAATLLSMLVVSVALAGRTIAHAEAGPAVIAPDLPPTGPVRGDLDSYGGWTGLKGKATGFFHVEQLGNRTWLVTPEGNVYFMLHMGWTHKGDKDRVKSWGFNAAERETGIPYAVDLNLFRLAKKTIPVPQIPGAPPWWTFPDVFDPEWQKQCQQQAQSALGPIANDPLLIGYYMVNEVSLDGWYEAAMHTTKDAPARAAFVEVARAYYANKPADLVNDWKAFKVAKIEDLLNVDGDAPNVPGLKDAWLATVAEKAFSIPALAAKAADPNHLNLGLRLFNAPLPAPVILKAMGKYCDVISMNLYSVLPDRLLTQMFTILPAMAMLTGRPTLTSEFSYRGGDTVHPNTMGAMPTVKTQAERAIGYMSYVAAVASIPTHVGVSWYKYPDDSPDASWEGYAEDCNFGVVDPQNRPYAVLTEAMRTTNASIYELAADPVRSKTCPLFWRTELLRWDRPYDEILLQRLLHSSAPFVDPLAQQLPEPRRYHESYWVSHHDPKLIVNDERFVGWNEGNMVKTDARGTTLVLFNVQAFVTFPRALWLGPQCANSDKPIALESNAQFMSRTIDPAGKLLRLTIADGSFIRTDGATAELRLDKREAYLDIRLDHAAKQAAVVTRGDAKKLGIAGIGGWETTLNGTTIKPTGSAAEGALTLFNIPS